jgi:hypothetical protein
MFLFFILLLRYLSSIAVMIVYFCINGCYWHMLLTLLKMKCIHKKSNIDNALMKQWQIKSTCDHLSAALAAYGVDVNAEIGGGDGDANGNDDGNDNGNGNDAMEEDI